MPCGLDTVFEHVTYPFGIREAEPVERRVQKRVRAVAPLQLENFVLRREPGQEVGRLPVVFVQDLVSSCSAGTMRLSSAWRELKPLMPSRRPVTPHRATP
jgi:hypothetical protein